MLFEKSINEDKKEICACIFKFIDKLPKDEQILLELSEVEKISQKEIALKLNSNYTTIRSKIQRSRKGLC